MLHRFFGFLEISLAAFAMTGTAATSCMMAPMTGPIRPRALAPTLARTMVMEMMMFHLMVLRVA